MDHSTTPYLGFGVNFIFNQLPELFATRPSIDWLEFEPDLFFNDESKLRILEEIAEQYPIVLHCLDISIGNAAPLDWEFLKKLKILTKKIRAPWVSDHLSWGKISNTFIRGALPLPFSYEVIDYIANRARIIQDYLEVPFALENIPASVAFRNDIIPEYEFFTSVVEKANISMLLDLHNLYSSSRNLGFDPKEYYSQLPLDRIIEIHIGKCMDQGGHFVTSLDGPVSQEVWDIYRDVYPKTKNASVLFEQANLTLKASCEEALKAKRLSLNSGFVAF